jgi:hypothetical protein
MAAEAGEPVVELGASKQLEATGDFLDGEGAALCGVEFLQSSDEGANLADLR